MASICVRHTYIEPYIRLIKNTNHVVGGDQPFLFLMIRAKILPYISTGPPRLWAFLPITYTYHSSPVIIIKVFPWIILALQP